MARKTKAQLLEQYRNLTTECCKLINKSLRQELKFANNYTNKTIKQYIDELKKEIEHIKLCMESKK